MVSASAQPENPKKRASAVMQREACGFNWAVIENCYLLRGFALVLRRPSLHDARVK